MPDVTVYQYFTFTDDAGNTYTDGSLTSGQTIAAADGEVFDRTYKVAQNTIKEILSDDLLGNSSTPDSFDFLFISSSADAQINLLVGQDGTYGDNKLENHFTIYLTANVPFILSKDDGRTLGDIAGGTLSQYDEETDSWEDTNMHPPGVINRIEFYCTGSGGAKVRVFAVT